MSTELAEIQEHSSSSPVKTKLEILVLVYKNNSAWVGCEDLVQQLKYVQNEDGELLSNDTIAGVFEKGHNGGGNEQCIDIGPQQLMH